jgi:hypothetical protein
MNRVLVTGGGSAAKPTLGQLIGACGNAEWEE